MFHGDTDERQCLELHMVRKEGGMGKGDQWLLAVNSDLAAKGSAKDLEVAVLVRFTTIFPSPFFPYHVYF